MEIALLGNPNTGKTSLFNNLTGSYEYVGNWSGVTVEKKVGKFKKYSHAKLIDLPGIYTLNPLSKDEGVVTEFLLSESCDKLLNIVDASQLERNLNLTIQLLEYGKPLVIGLNMVDVAKGRGIQVDPAKLTGQLGVPVIPVIARNGSGCDILEQEVTNGVVAKGNPLSVQYGPELDNAFLKLEELLDGKNIHQVKWLALQLFEGNLNVKTYLSSIIDEKEIELFTKSVEQSVVQNTGSKSIQHYIYQKRKETIQKVVQASILTAERKSIPLTEKVDKIVTNKVLGIPIFLVIMYLMFMLTFDWLGVRLSDLLDGLIAGPVTAGIENLLITIGATSFIKALILDGIVAGVGGVLVFVPQIFILFMFISLLEDSGYMARVALVMDRIMETVGMNGKAFIPMMIGFGCNVPGVMAARTIETPKERMLTVLLTPLMSCSARMPVYALFVGAFFLANKALIVLSLYVVGIVVAFLLAKLFSVTILKGETSLFVIELPPYRMPQARSILRSTWEKGKGFIKKAGTFIFAGSVLIWVLANAGSEGFNVDMDESYLAAIGGLFAPIFAPIGFGTWQASASLITGFFAKEVVVSTMNIIYFAPDEAGLQGMLSQFFTPLSAYSFMAFVLIYIPCLATVATIYSETRSKKWTIFSMGYALIVAYLLCLLIYQGGQLLGLS